MSVILALTIGEPSSIAYEITLKAWQFYKNQRDVIFFVCAPENFGDGAVQYIDNIANAARVFPNALPVLSTHDAVMPPPTLGTPNIAHVPYIMRSIESAVHLAQTKQVHGVVTLPIHKEIMQKGGFTFPGHTEYLAHLCEATNPIMMLVNDKVRAIPLTIHVPLKDILLHINEAKFHDILTKSLYFLYHNGCKEPVIAIAGLNPHAGENGHIGTEEQDFILPWLSHFKAKANLPFGYQLQGPLAADSLFHEEALQQYDMVLCWYHDQALIPVKTIDFHHSVNQTLGLPIIRTSPDHGTALSLAGQNAAKANSVIAAIKQAASTRSF